MSHITAGRRDTQVTYGQLHHQLARTSVVDRLGAAAAVQDTWTPEQAAASRARISLFVRDAPSGRLRSRIGQDIYADQPMRAATERGGGR